MLYCRSSWDLLIVIQIEIIIFFRNYILDGKRNYRWNQVEYQTQLEGIRGMLCINFTKSANSIIAKWYCCLTNTIISVVYNRAAKPISWNGSYIYIYKRSNCSQRYTVSRFNQTNNFDMLAARQCNCQVFKCGVYIMYIFVLHALSL